MQALQLKLSRKALVLSDLRGLEYMSAYYECVFAPRAYLQVGMSYTSTLTPHPYVAFFKISHMKTTALMNQNTLTSVNSSE